MNSVVNISQRSCIKHQHHMAKIGPKIMQEIPKNTQSTQISKKKLAYIFNPFFNM